MSDWYSSGFDGAEQRHKEKEERISKGKIKRIWIKPFTSVEVIFLDDQAFSFDEHQVYLNGSWTNWFTCLGMRNGCPPCVSDNKPYRATVFTVIDLSKWSDRKGNVHQNEKKLLVVKEDTTLALKQKFERWGGLKGKQVIISRKDKDDYSSGSDFELAMSGGQILKPDMSKFQDIQPYDYKEVFKPLTPDALRSIMSMSSTSERAAQEVPVDKGTGGSTNITESQNNSDLSEIPF